MGQTVITANTWAASRLYTSTPGALHLGQEDLCSTRAARSAGEGGGLSLVTPEGRGNWNPVRQFYINHQDRLTGQWERGYISQMFHEKHDCGFKKKKRKTFPKFQRKRFAAPARFHHVCRPPSIIAAVKSTQHRASERATRGRKRAPHQLSLVYFRLGQLVCSKFKQLKQNWAFPATAGALKIQGEGVDTGDVFPHTQEKINSSSQP